MTSTHQLISELIRAANEVDRLSASEVKRLLDRAISEISDLRHQVGIIPILGRDAAIYVSTVAAGADRVPREEWHHGLLHAAEMMRDLYIVASSGTDITVRESAD
ncbi:hypothetical protein [Shinella sp.]|uniref:hypothetical protein n=1 Tax=Shinella sp. TaxID=1870904 RepID=UPI0028994825|nr:hypothetical protein [Shinella sp.]